MFGLGTTEIIIVLVIALLVFGPQKLPEIGRQIGGLMREFRRMSDDMRNTFNVDELTGLNRYDTPSTSSYYPATDYGPDLAHSGDGGDTRLDQQAIGRSDEAETFSAGASSDGGAVDDVRTVSRGGASVYDAPRPWSLTDGDLEDESEPSIGSAAGVGGFAPVVTVAPPGPPSAQTALRVGNGAAGGVTTQQ